MRRLQAGRAQNAVKASPENLAALLPFSCSRGKICI